MLSPDPKIKQLVGQQEDLLVTCVDCSKDFVFSKGEQDFYQTKGLFAPKRCPSCRKIKKAKMLREEASKNA